MNNKIKAFMVLLIAFTICFTIISSEQTNYPKISHTKNFTVTQNKGNYSVITNYSGNNTQTRIIFYGNNTSTSVTPDTTAGMTSLNVGNLFFGNYSQIKNDFYPNADYFIAEQITGNITTNLGTYYINIITGLNPNPTSYNNFSFDAYDCNLQFKILDSAYNTLNSSASSVVLAPLPVTMLFNPIENYFAYAQNVSQSLQKTSTFFQTSYKVFTNIPIGAKAYYVTFIDNQSFTLKFENQTYSSENDKLTLLMFDGSYNYSFSTNGVNYTKANIVISGFNLTVNLIYVTGLFSGIYAFYVYIGVMLLGMGMILTGTKGFFTSYVLSGLIFMFIGYKLDIEYFNLTLIVSIITIIAGIIAYKFVLES